MRARLTNYASLPRAIWTDVSVPYGSLTDDEMIFRVDGGPALRATKTLSLANHSTFYSVHTHYEGSQTLTGEFVPGQHPSGSPPFTFTDWVTDDWGDIIPKWSVLIDGQPHAQENPTVEFFSISKAHHWMRIHGRLSGAASGFVGTIWLKFYHLQDAVRMEGRLVWSDRDDKKLDKKVDGIALESGEYIHIYYKGRNRHRGPYNINGRWVWVLADEISFTDGSGFPVFGTMACLPKDTSNLDPTTDDPVLAARIQNLYASMQDGVGGAAMDAPWNGTWLSSKWTPRLNHDLPMDGEWTQFLEMLETPAPRSLGSPPHALYARRPVGAAETPWQTGEQEDHGATRGGRTCSMGDPRYLKVAEYSLQGDFFRGFCHYEKDGSFLEASNHPDWVTWSGRTHWPVSQDKLGKDRPGWGEGKSTGWDNYDDQHRSGNNWAAFCALRDSPMMIDLLHHQIRTDQAMTKDRMGAPRAVGRLLLFWANAYSILDDGWDDKCRALMDEKVQATLNHWEGGKHTGPVKILHAFTDGRMKITSPAGDPLPGWVVWEHALLAVGLWACYKTTANQQAHDLLKQVLETIVRYATFSEAGKWYICSHVWYPETPRGEPIDQNLYSTTSPYVNVDPGQGGVTTWIVPALLIAQEVFTGELADRAKEITDGFTGGREATNWKDAEWWCVVEKIADSSS